MACTYFKKLMSMKQITKRASSFYFFFYYSEIIFILTKLNEKFFFLFILCLVCFYYIIYSLGLQVLTRGINLGIRQPFNTAKSYSRYQSVYMQQNGNTKLTAAWLARNSIIICKTNIFFIKFNFFH